MKAFKVMLMILGGILLTLFTVAFIWGFVEEMTKDEPTTSRYNIENDFEAPTDQSDKMTSAERASFIEGCSPDDPNDPYCVCVFNYLDRTLTNDEFWDLAIKYGETDQIPDEMVTAAETCL